MEFSINIQNVQATSNQLHTIKNNIRKDSFRIQDVANDLRKTDDTALHIFSLKLETQIVQLQREMLKLNSMQKSLDKVLQIYNETEENIASETFTVKKKRKWKVTFIPVNVINLKDINITY